MKVQLDLALDFEGQHTLAWQPTENAAALDVPRATLDRWNAEREAFKVASLRWKRVIEEVEEQLYRAERDRLGVPDVFTAKSPSRSSAIAAQLEQAVVGAGRGRRRRV